MLLDPGLPLVGYRFIVTIYTGILVPNPVDIQFQEVEGLSKTRSISMENGNLTLNDGPSAGTLTLKRGLFTSPSQLIAGNVTESIFWDTRALRKDFMVNVLDEDDTPVNAWKIGDAYLESWDWNNLNAESGLVIIESMKFKYSSIEYVALKQAKTGR